MSEINVSSSVAQAIEVMNSILAGSFLKWIDERGDCGGNFLSVWGDCHCRNTYGFFKKRISAFSTSLQGLRVMQVLPGVMTEQEAHGRSCDDALLRNVRFQIGNEKHPELVTIQVLLEHSEPLWDRPIWGNWMLSYEKAVTCLKHPDKKFAGCVILGLEAVPIDDRKTENEEYPFDHA